MGRQPILTVAVGKKGVGKTYRTLELLKTYVKGTPTFKPRRVLILDTNNEFVGVPSIDIKNIGWFSRHPKIEMRRVRVFHPNGKKMSLNEISDTLGYILDNFIDGALLIEDINKFTGDTLNTELIGGIVTQRHMDCDIILHFQSIGRAGQPKILGNMNVLRMHKTFDSVDRHQNKFEDRYEIVKIGENIVNMKYRGYELDGRVVPPNERFALYCDFDRDKIVGDFTRREVEECVKEYIWANESVTIKPMLRKRDDEGNFKYTDRTVLKAKVDDLVDLYFTFKKAS